MRTSRSVGESANHKKQRWGTLDFVITDELVGYFETADLGQLTRNLPSLKTRPPALVEFIPRQKKGGQQLGMGVRGCEFRLIALSFGGT